MGTLTIPANRGIRRRAAQKFVVAAAVLTLLSSTSVSAYAAPNNAQEGVANLIDRVAPDQGAVVRGHSLPEVTQVTVADTAVTIADDPSVPVKISSPEGTSLEVQLPDHLNLEDAVLTTDGTVVYRSADETVDAAVQTLEDGSVRFQTVINDASAAHEFSYSLGGGFVPVEASDGSIVAAKVSENDFQAFTVSDAWARDANGQEVPTHYEIRGNDLVQVVTPAPETVYPIVADPRWMWYNFAYGAQFSKSETRTLAAAGGIAGFCVLLPAGAIQIACGVAGAQWFTQASLAANANTCVFIAAVPAPIAVRYFGSGCV